METSDIMTVEEVAQYLRVSERTIYDWAQKGEIPCGKLGTTWRFKRSEIEGWVDSRLGAKKRRPAARPLPLHSVITPERVLLLEAKHKVDALDGLIEVLATAPEVKDRDELAEAVYQREELMSTGIGHGIAVPHVRLPSVKNIVAAAGLCRRPLTDYESLDDDPVRLIFMVAAGSDQHQQYIKLLSAISGRVKDQDLRDALLKASDERQLFELFVGRGD